MNWTGLLLGFIMFFAIGGGFVWVIKLEYYIGAHIWRGGSLIMIRPPIEWCSAWQARRQMHIHRIGSKGQTKETNIGDF